LQAQEMLLTYYPNDIKRIEVIYECEWKDFKIKNGLEMEAFWQSSQLPKLRPLVRLTPRASGVNFIN
jgi:hypothetical protein